MESPPQTLRAMKLQTVILYVQYLVLGIVVAVPGPTIVNMRALFDTDTTTLSLSLSLNGAGYMAGAALCGCFFHRLSSDLQFSAGMCVAALSFMACPWSGNVYALIVLMTLFGVGIGYVDTGGNTQIITLWRGHRSKDPLLQGLHFSWSIGSTIAPFLITPFLTEIRPHQNSGLGKNFNLSGSNSSNITTNNGSYFTRNNSSNTLDNSQDITGHHSSNLGHQSSTTIGHHSLNITGHHSTNVTVSDIDEQAYSYGVSLVRYAYFWTGLLGLVMALTYLFMFCTWGAKCRVSKHDTVMEDDRLAKSPGILLDTKRPEKIVIDTQATTQEKRAEARFARYGLLVQLFLFAFTFGIALNVAGGYYSLFVVESLSWSVSHGALITSTYMGALGVGRLVGIPIAYFVSSKRLLLINLLLTVTGHIALNFSHGFGPVGLFAVVSLAGLGLSTMGVNVLLWVSGHLKVTSAVSATFFTGNSLGFVVGYAAVGNIMQVMGYYWFTYCVMATSIVQVVLVMSMQVYISLVLPKKPKLVVETDVIEIDKEKESMLDLPKDQLFGCDSNIN